MNQIIFQVLLVFITLCNTSYSQVQQRPFKGTIEGNFVLQQTTNPSIYTGSANANGHVTHLGTFNKVTSDIVNLSSSSVEGSFIMTSTAGEKLTGFYYGTLSLGNTPGTFSWLLNAIITGGTGRFSFASGEFIFLAEGSYEIMQGSVSGIYTETFDGTINY